MTQRNKRHLLPAVLFCLAVAMVGTWVVSERVQAQVLYGGLVGTVKDSTGASVPGATITATNKDTGLQLTAVSDDTGNYTVTNVLPGSYDVKVSLPGFKEFLKTDVPVTTANISRVDATLQVGQLAETVTVASEATLMQTDKADVHTELQSTAVVNLPLANYRNYQSLLNLVPGATPTTFQNARIDTPARSLRTFVNGVNPNNNTTRTDGATNINIWLPHHAVYVAPAETVDTVNISTNNFDAEQGMAGGAAVTVNTKSGTNELHGSAFAYYNDQRFNARSFFALPRPDSRRQFGVDILPESRHIFGGTIGGPIVRNKLFYFGSWEGQYWRSGQFTFYDVPTVAIRNGDFSGASRIMYDPMTGNPDGTGRRPFPDNRIPADRISDVSRRIQALYPLPNLAGETRNYIERQNAIFDRNNYDVKINWNRESAHQIWGKFSIMDAFVSDLFQLGVQGGGRGDTRVYLTTVGHTWTFGPSLVLDGNFGFTRQRQTVKGPDFGQNFGLDVLRLPGTNGPDSRQSGRPYFDTGYSGLGNSASWNPLFRDERVYTFASNLSKIKGDHDLRFGFQGNYLWLNHWQPEIGAGPRGRFDFGGGVTALRGGPEAPNFYNSYAAFLLGLPTSVSKSLQYELMTGREWQWGIYGQDRWKVNDRLTLTLGLRWEYYPLMHRANRGLEVLDLNRMEVLLGGVGGNPRNLGIKVSKKLFAPRVGLAYRLNNETVFRAGYGITYNPLPFSRPLRGFFPLTIAASFPGPDAFTPRGRIEAGIPEFTGPDLSSGRIPLPPTVDMRWPDPDNVRRGYIQSWNLMFERRLPLDMSLSTGYVGTRTIRGFADLDLNAGSILGPPGNTGRPFFSRFSRTASTLLWGARTESRYHSLQMALNRGFKNGLLLKGSYTFSKAMNWADEDGWQGLTWNDPTQLRRNFALAGFDRPHNFQFGFLYELPFGRNAAHPVYKALLRDWQFNGIFSAFSGTPFTVTTSSASLDTPGNSQTADQVAPVRQVDGRGPDEVFYDPSAWAAVTTRRYGTTGRNSQRGPGAWNLDMSVFRRFPITERLRLEFRAEAYNLTNTPKFGNPNSSVTGSRFMQITGAAAAPIGDPRRFQFGLRLVF